MKCKDCTMDYCYRTSDAEKECEFQNSRIQFPDKWKDVRIQTAIIVMQSILTNNSLLDKFRSKHPLDCHKIIAQKAVEQANALIEELRKEK